MQKVMGQVLLALVPGTIAMVWYFGMGVLINVLLASATAVTCEAAMLRLRSRDPMPAVSDLSAVVTAALLGLALPTLAPWWLPVVGAAFAVVIAKQLYGGLGYNPFNPAMAGYVVLLISFPVQMTTWLGPAGVVSHDLGIGETLAYVFGGVAPAGAGLDAYTMATPLDTMKTELGLNRMVEEIRANPLFGDIGGRGWEWVANWYLLGGLWLIYRRVITWHIPVAMLVGLVGTAAFMYPLGTDSQPFPLFHLFSGGAILGAFFIATDPVSACSSNRGKLIFGAGIGILTYIIRTWGGYPDGVAFSVLLMNMAAPTIDYYTQPRAFGH